MVEQAKLPNVFTYQVIDMQAVTSSVTQLFLSPIHSPHLTYQAGQYIHALHADGSASPLSIASAPLETGVLEFHLYHSEQNQKAWELLRMAQEDKKWTIQGPFGHCTIDRLDPEKPQIMFARGTGFAPIKAVMEAWLQRPFIPSVHFYWSVLAEQDLYLMSLIEEWISIIKHFIFIPVFTQDVGSHVLPDRILEDHPNLSEYQVYASGPRPLIKTAFTDFVEKGRLCAGHFYSDVL